MENIRDLVKMHQLEEIIDKYSEIQIDSDLSLFDKIGNELYGFVKYVILTNKTDIVFEKINSSLYEYIDTDLHLDNNSLINFHVHHSDSVEAKFNSDPDPYYVYHGTLCKNWYSIMQNGLKNYSGTAMMKNGAAYGPGIYLAQNPELAFRYSAFNKDNKKIKDDMIIIGVVQILDRHKYDKKNGIYVVPDEDNVLLKYLILLNKKDIPLIKPYYDKITKEIQTTASLIDSIMEKRLLNEFKKATKIPNVIISLSGSNNMEWNIMITDIIFKFYFSKQYPLIPPVIKVIYDANNVNITKILNHENIVLMKELDKNHWNIRNNVCQIIKLLDKKIKI
jgi:ubiquitin-protein ligase